MTTKNANGHLILPVGLGDSTLIEKNYKIEMGGTPFRRYARTTQIPIGHEQVNSGFAKLALTNEKTVL